MVVYQASCFVKEHDNFFTQLQCPHLKVNHEPDRRQYGATEVFNFR